MSKYDVVVIGSGPGGYVAAIRAAQLGGKVAIVEKYQLGGTCLNRGCIPTKAMIQSANLWSNINRSAEFGIKVGAKEFSHKKMMKRCNDVVTKLRNGVEYLLKQNKVAVINGSGRVLGRGRVGITADKKKKEIACNKIIIATGSEPLEVPGMPFGKNTLSSTDVLQLKETPKSMIIIGGGAVGVEFASVFNQLGTKVTIIEMLKQLVPLEDKRVANVLEADFKKRGIKVCTGNKVTKVKETAARVSCELESGEKFSAEKMLVAVGRKLNIDDIGLEEAGIETDRGIVVDDFMETSVAGIYAIGDVTNKMLLAHLAHHQGVVAAENAMGLDTRIDYRVIPSAIYSMPEIASVGLNEKAAKNAGHNVKSSRFPFMAAGKAMIAGETEGFVQIVSDKATGEILGIQIVGIDATNLIGEAVALIGVEATTAELGHLVHPHPTLSEALMEAGLAAQGHPIHIYMK